METDEARILLRAAYDLFHKQAESFYTLDLLAETATWNGVECDGYCLMEEIADLLGIEEN